MSRPVDVLLDYLRGEELRGVSHVYLDEESKVALRELHRLSREKKSQPAAAVAARPVAEAAHPVRDARATVKPGGSKPLVAKPPLVRELQVSREGSAAERIAALKAQAEQWGPARSLGTLREAMVFSTGNPEAELMLVGEAPGYQEERQREPFVGPAGQKLNDILKAMGISREEVYISNIVKFRPSAPKQTTNNRKPTSDEMAACLPFVREEIEIVKPRCIVALGASAAEGLLSLGGAVGKMRGEWYEFMGVPTRVTYHPAYLLHGTAGLKDKRMIWEDMLAVMKKLDLPISDKQRGFFLPKP